MEKIFRACYRLNAETDFVMTKLIFSSVLL